MKTGLLVLSLLTVGTLAAATHVSIGIGVGVPYAGPYAWYPPPPPPVYYAPPCPGPGYIWTPGYYYRVGPSWTWRAGYWAAPPYPAYRVRGRAVGYGYGHAGRPYRGGGRGHAHGHRR